jgi:hypothetical protein
MWKKWFFESNGEKMTATEKLHEGMNAAQTGMDDAIARLKKLAHKLESRHDQVIEQIRRTPPGSDEAQRLEELRAGLAATANYCRATIEAHTGEPMPESKLHDARDQGGKFTPKGSIGHIFRRIVGKG